MSTLSTIGKLAILLARHADTINQATQNLRDLAEMMQGAKDGDLSDEQLAAIDDMVAEAEAEWDQEIAALDASAEADASAKAMLGS